MTRLALLALACSLETNVPNISDPCSRAVIASYTAPPEECVRLDDANGLALFRLSTSQDCGGPSCIRYGEEQTAYVLEKIAPNAGAEWAMRHGPCSEIPYCRHSKLCDEEPARCE
jgi:hypothetical protein